MASISLVLTEGRGVDPLSVWDYYILFSHPETTDWILGATGLNILNYSLGERFGMIGAG